MRLRLLRPWRRVLPAGLGGLADRLRQRRPWLRQHSLLHRAGSCGSAAPIAAAALAAAAHAAAALAAAAHAAAPLAAAPLAAAANAAATFAAATVPTAADGARRASRLCGDDRGDLGGQCRRL